jgi:hypothetical protein
MTANFPESRQFVAISQAEHWANKLPSQSILLRGDVRNAASPNAVIRRVFAHV